jgi:hypothetical protein
MLCLHVKILMNSITHAITLVTYVVLQLFKVRAPEAPADPKAAGKAASSSGAAAAAAAPGGGRPSSSKLLPDATAAADPPEPCSLLTPKLAAALNPIVLCADKVKNLPDAPATQQQLDTMCERVKLRAVWPGMVSTAAAPGHGQQELKMLFDYVLWYCLRVQLRAM